MDYSEAKLQQLDAATTFRVYGHEVDFDQSGASSGGTARRRWRPITPCFCVQDSTDSPCECMRGEHWWCLREDAVTREGNSGHKEHEGNDLKFFDVLVDSQIVVESPQSVSTAALKGLGDAISAQRIRGLASDSGPGAPQTIEAAIPPWVVKLLIRMAAYLLDKYWDEITEPIHWPPPK